MTIENALQKLYSMHQFGVKLGLENITNLLRYLGNPEKKFKSFHIAGSNGKGSTASFVSSILIEAGFKTGLYTSPHLVNFNERVRINGEEIPDKFIAEFILSHQKYIDENNPTFFEITTALAFTYFAENKVDYAVIETGLGGRLDATNTIIPEAAIITSISREHTNILGNSLAEIAGEKAGILKSGIPVFTGVMPKEAEEVIEKKSKEKGCALFRLNDFLQIKNAVEDLEKKSKEDLNPIFKQHDFHQTKSAFVELELGEKKYKIYDLPLQGFHQKLNASLALLALNKTLHVSDYKIINESFVKVVENSGLQARYEVVNENPKVIFDAAHNPEGTDAFIKEFENEFEQYEERILLFGVMKDKNAEEMLNVLKPYFTKFILTTIDYRRAAEQEDLTELAGKLDIAAEPVKDPARFISDFTKTRNNKSCLVVIGSIYVIGAIKANLF